MVAKNDHAVVLVSGGIDSATCLGIACNKYERITPVHIDYGQQTSTVEQVLARGQCQHMAEEYPDTRISRTPVIEYSDVFKHFAEGVADDEKTFGHMTEDDGRSSGYVPMRNLHLLATAAAIADVEDADAIYHGAQAGDEADYPDCRPEFLDRAAGAINKSLPGDEYIDVRAPLLHSSKTEVLEEGHDVGVNFELTYSCYGEVEDPFAPNPCGNCPACKEREEAFEQTEFSDPHGE